MREAQIKAALIDRLFDDGFIDDETVVISELPVSSWSRRADLVLANGKISGFEIKSKFDSTARLGAQLEAYATSFEGVSVVIDDKHLAAVESISHPNVGIFIITDRADAVEILMHRKPHFKRLTIEAALRLLMLADLRNLLRNNAIEYDKTVGRQGFERQVRDLPLNVVRDAAAIALKRRYSHHHGCFTQARASGVKTLDALKELRRPSWNTSEAPRYQAKYAGPLLPIKMPKFSVTPRKVVS